MSVDVFELNSENFDKFISDKIDSSKVEAKFENGLLNITIPKILPVLFSGRNLSN